MAIGAGGTRRRSGRVLTGFPRRDEDTTNAMALIDCPECGKQVSTAAAACPYCGFPVASQLGPSAQAKTEGDKLLAEVRPSWWRFFWYLVFAWLIVPWIIAWSRAGFGGTANLPGPDRAGAGPSLEELSRGRSSATSVRSRSTRACSREWLALAT